MSESRDTRTEQCLAFGRSHAWILTHLGGTQADINRAIERMNAAASGDNAAWLATLVGDEAPVVTPGSADPEVIRELVDAICPKYSRRKKVAL